MLLAFESSVVFNSSKTAFAVIALYSTFESSVVFNSSKTLGRFVHSRVLV